jgi:hypothetical protein
VSSFGDGYYIWFYHYHFPMIVWTLSVMGSCVVCGWCMVYALVLVYSTYWYKCPYMACASYGALVSSALFVICYFYTL